MTVVILRDVLKEMQVPFKLSDKKALLVSKLKGARAKDNDTKLYPGFLVFKFKFGNTRRTE